MCYNETLKSAINLNKNFDITQDIGVYYRF